MIITTTTIIIILMIPIMNRLEHGEEPEAFSR